MADESRIKVQLHRKDRTDERWIPLTTGGCVQLTDYENDGTAELPITIGSEEAYDTLNTALAKLENGLSGFADVAHTGDYDDLTNKPEVNDATVTVKVNGVVKGSFTLNQSTNYEIDIPVPENPVIFKGTVNTTGINGTSAPFPPASADNNGHEYKVTENGTYQGVAAKVGDILISNGTAWIRIPSGDEPDGTVTEITATNGVKTSTGQAITTIGQIELADVYGTAPGANGESADKTLSFGGTFKVLCLNVDEHGRVTAVSEKTMTLPSAELPTLATADKVLKIVNDNGTLKVAWGDDNNTEYTAGKGLTLGSGVFKAKMDSETSLGTIGTTAKLYAVGVDSSDKLCVAVPWTDTTYASETAQSGGTTVSLVTTGEKYNWNNKANKQVDAPFSSTSLTIKSGYNYTATSAISSLMLTYDSTNKADPAAAQSASNMLGSGDLETNIIFTVSGSSFTLTPPSGTNIVTPEYVDSIPTWESGKKYIVSVYKGLFVFGEIKSSWS